MASRRYTLAYVIQDQQARAAMAHGVSDFAKLEHAALKGATAAERAWAKTAAQIQAATAAMAQAARTAGARANGYTNGAANGNGYTNGNGNGAATAAATAAYANGNGNGAPAAAPVTASKKKQVDDLAAIEDRYLKRDYDRRVQHEARKQQAAEAAAASQSAAKAKAAERDAAIQDRLLKRDANQQAKHAARQAKAAESAAAGESAGKQKSADQLQAIQDRLLMKDYNQRAAHEARKDRVADRTAAAAQRQQDQAANRAVKQKEREAAQLQKIEDRYIRDEYRRRIAYQSKLEADQVAATARMERRVVVASAAVSTAAYAGLKILNDGYAKLRDDAEAAAGATIKLRQGLRVESTLKGAERTDNKRLQESLQFRVETGLGEQEASDFTRQYLGSVPAGFQKGNIDQKTSDELMKEAGKMAARQGGDTSTRGDLAGILSQFGKVKSSEEGLGQLEAIRIALTEGRGDDTPLTRELLTAAGAMVGEGRPVGSLPEMAALIGVKSLTNPQEAATNAKRSYRFLSETQPRGKAFLDRSGIKESMNLEQKLDKLAPIVNDAIAKGRDPVAFLSEAVGGGNNEEIQSVVSDIGNLRILKERLAKSRKAGQGAEVKAANERFYQAPEGRQAVGEQLQAAAQVTLGLKGERFKAAKTATEATPEIQAGDQSIIQTQFWDRLAGYLQGNLSDPTKTGREFRVEGAAIDELQRRAKASGVTPQEMEAAKREAYKAGDVMFQPEFFNRVESMIEKKGGSVAPNVIPAMEKLNKTMEELNRLMGRMKPGAAAAIAGAPPLNPRPAPPRL